MNRTIAQVLPLLVAAGMAVASTPVVESAGLEESPAGCRLGTQSEAIESFDGTSIGCTFFLPEGDASGQPAPVVMVGSGSLQSRAREPGDTNSFRQDVWWQVQEWLDLGYAVLTWDVRGNGSSGGYLSIGRAEEEGRDGQALIDWLAAQPEVMLDAPGDPRLAIVGHPWTGGQSAFSIGKVDARVDAIVGDFGRWDLGHFAHPNDVWASTELAVICSLTHGGGLLDGLPNETTTLHPDFQNMCAEWATQSEPSQRTLDLFARYQMGDALNGGTLEDGTPVPGVTMPTMVVHSVLDFQDGSKHLNLYRALTGPDAVGPRDEHQLLIYDGHFIARERSPDVAERITRFVNHHLRGEGHPGVPIAWQQSNGYEGLLFSQVAPGGWEGRTTLPQTTFLEASVTVDLVHAVPAATSDDYNGSFDECARTATMAGQDLGCPERWFRVDDLPDEVLIFGDGKARAVIRSDAADVRVFVKLIEFDPADGSAYLVNWMSTALRADRNDTSAERVVEAPIDALLHRMEPGHELYVGVAASSNYYANALVPFTGQADVTVSIPIERDEASTGIETSLGADGEPVADGSLPATGGGGAGVTLGLLAAGWVTTRLRAGRHELS